MQVEPRSEEDQTWGAEETGEKRRQNNRNNEPLCLYLFVMSSPSKPNYVGLHLQNEWEF